MPLVINLLYQIFDFKVSEKKENVLNYKSFVINDESKLGKYFPQKSTKRGDDLEQIITQARINAYQILKAIRDNKNFAVKPLDSGRICSYCLFQSICKIEIY
jgi:ATP-dependent helicase/DNAse subunit B